MTNYASIYLKYRYGKYVYACDKYVYGCAMHTQRYETEYAIPEISVSVLAVSMLTYYLIVLKHRPSHTKLLPCSSQPIH